MVCVIGGASLVAFCYGYGAYQLVVERRRPCAELGRSIVWFTSPAVPLSALGEGTPHGLSRALHRVSAGIGSQGSGVYFDKEAAGPYVTDYGCSRNPTRPWWRALYGTRCSFRTSPGARNGWRCRLSGGDDPNDCTFMARGTPLRHVVREGALCLRKACVRVHLLARAVTAYERVCALK